MHRRTLLACGAALVALQAGAGNAQLLKDIEKQPTPFRPPVKGQVGWRQPGVRAVKDLKGLSQRERRELSLNALFADSKTPQSVRAILRRGVLEGGTPYADRVSEYYPIGRMAFASDDFRSIIVLSDVVAETNAPGWVGKSTQKIGWRYHDSSTNVTYVVEEPDVCQNLLLSIFVGGECVKDPARCGPGCSELRTMISV